jgi:hypothetical protein
MNRLGHESADFFLGQEVEHTPAHGMDTLFVIGYHTQEEIEQHLNRDIRHIFFGANDSYRPTTPAEHTAWENVILTFLDRGLWCSLDIHTHNQSAHTLHPTLELQYLCEDR